MIDPELGDLWQILLHLFVTSKIIMLSVKNQKAVCTVLFQRVCNVIRHLIHTDSADQHQNQYLIQQIDKNHPFRLRMKHSLSHIDTYRKYLRDKKA